jgi:hypothetical protein
VSLKSEIKPGWGLPLPFDGVSRSSNENKTKYKP